MYYLKLYLVFHLAGGVPLCWHTFRNEPRSWKVLFRFLFGLLIWPIPTAIAVYEAVQEIRNRPANGDPKDI